MARANDASWAKICKDHNILSHNFKNSPFILRSADIKTSCQNFKKTSQKEVRILCKQDSREDRPEVFQQNELFLLPVKNGEYAIIKGDGYIDIPDITSKPIPYKSSLPFMPDTSIVGDSEMQHLDFAYAASLIRTVMQDKSLVLTIRGRKYTPEFSFIAGKYNTQITQQSVQTEVDAGYEGVNNVLLVEAKNAATENVIIRQMYYPFRQWQEHTKKPVHLIFFEKRENLYYIWQFSFSKITDYNSIQLVNSWRYLVS